MSWEPKDTGDLLGSNASMTSIIRVFVVGWAQRGVEVEKCHHPEVRDILEHFMG